MTIYDLYCMIFLALDADWDDTHNEELGRYLSDANPFLFKDEGSAVPDIYPAFCKLIGDRKITKENSYELAKEYITHLNIPAVEESFELLEKEQWDDSLDEYMKSKS